MNWDAMGAIAEALGAIAVIATLVYLAVQVRHLKSELHMSSLKDQAETFSVVTNAVATSPELAKVLERAKEGNALEAWEARMVDHYFITWMNAFELLCNQENAGALAIQGLEVESVLTTFLRNETWAFDSWARNRGFWPENFQHMVDNEIKRILG